MNNDLIISTITNDIKALLIVLGIPACFILLLTIINRKTKGILASTFGFNSQLYLGCIGIIIHELSHLIMAIVFGHRVQSVRLLKMPNPNPINGKDSDLSLGYVNHIWNQNSRYQVIGNLFIGVAPVFGCTGILLGLMNVLAPNSYDAFLRLAETPNKATILSSVNSLLMPIGWWQPLLLLVITINIVIGGFDLSSADYRNSSMGLYTAIILIVIIASLLTIAGFTGWLTTLLLWFGTLSVILSYSLVLSIIIMLVVLALNHLKG
ncbi:hypothetical protein [Lactiplantibacillus plantarum]|uniref:hypothetical protein n=1 Tax=Lactiplantibacillus plantarum TaxID=1590 RepID=UPI001BA750AB|nr:hypothetical protein [Lactiplantibacillus plantarum]MBS0956815.1 hypothetical protein [Lactiplantibacillus plantarum]